METRRKIKQLKLEKHTIQRTQETNRQIPGSTRLPRAGVGKPSTSVSLNQAGPRVNIPPEDQRTDPSVKVKESMSLTGWDKCAQLLPQSPPPSAGGARAQEQPNRSRGECPFRGPMNRGEPLPHPIRTPGPEGHGRKTVEEVHLHVLGSAKRKKAGRGLDPRSRWWGGRGQTWGSWILGGGECCRRAGSTANDKQGTDDKSLRRGERR